MRNKQQFKYLYMYKYIIFQLPYIHQQHIVATNIFRLSNSIPTRNIQQQQLIEQFSTKKATDPVHRFPPQSNLLFECLQNLVLVAPQHERNRLHQKEFRRGHWIITRGKLARQVIKVPFCGVPSGGRDGTGRPTRRGQDVSRRRR
jgi:hypothetical protein